MKLGEATLHLSHSQSPRPHALASATIRGWRDQRQPKQARNKQSHEQAAWPPCEGARQGSDCTIRRVRRGRYQKPRACVKMSSWHCTSPGHTAAKRNTSTKRRTRNGGAVKLSWLELAVLPAPLLLRQQACRKKCWQVIQLLFFFFVQGKRCVISRVTCTQACYMCVYRVWVFGTHAIHRARLSSTEVVALEKSPSRFTNMDCCNFTTRRHSSQPLLLQRHFLVFSCALTICRVTTTNWKHEKNVFYPVKGKTCRWKTRGINATSHRSPLWVKPL